MENIALQMQAGQHVTRILFFIDSLTMNVQLGTVFIEKNVKSI